MSDSRECPVRFLDKRRSLALPLGSSESEVDFLHVRQAQAKVLLSGLDHTYYPRVLVPDTLDADRKN